MAVELNYPTVALGEPLGGVIPFVDYDFRRAAEVAVSHRASRGDRLIAYVGPREVERFSGHL